MKRIYNFTLLELLIVIAVIGILVSLLLPSLWTARERAKMAVCMSNIHQLHIGTHSYLSKNNGFYPSADDWTNTTPRVRNSLIIGEYYCEQAKETIFKFSGRADETPGRVTIGAARLHGWAQMKNFMEVNGFSGQVGYLHGHITKDRSAEHYNLIQSQTGKTQFLFAANSHNYFKFENNQKSTLHLLLNGSKDFKNKFSNEVFMRAINDFRILSEEAMKRFEK